jgi:TnpA family transposase
MFGLFFLLGYQFSPRISDAGEARFWRIDRAADYGLLDDLSRRNTIKTEIIRDNWEDILRVAGSLKLGTVKASDLVRAPASTSSCPTASRYGRSTSSGATEDAVWSVKQPASSSPGGIRQRAA